MFSGSNSQYYGKTRVNRGRGLKVTRNVDILVFIIVSREQKIALIYKQVFAL